MTKTNAMENETKEESLKNWILWLQARIPELKNRAYVYWLKLALEGFHEQNDWIEAAVKLPDHETDVICYCEAFEVRVGRHDGCWFIDGYGLPQEVTHWKELPKTPIKHR